MKRIEREASDADVGFVLVSLDPARDSSGRLAAFAREHGLAADRWTLLGGGDDDVRELAAALGVRYRRLSPAELAHSNTLTLLDASGAVAYQRAGLGDVDETVAAVRALQR
jgi:protein SCO1/2